jgi:hypothetical protein
MPGYNDVQIEDRLARVPIAYFEEAAAGEIIEITQAPDSSMPGNPSPRRGCRRTGWRTRSACSRSAASRELPWRRRAPPGDGKSAWRCMKLGLDARRSSLQSHPRRYRRMRYFRNAANRSCDRRGISGRATAHDCAVCGYLVVFFARRARNSTSCPATQSLQLKAPRQV